MISALISRLVILVFGLLYPAYSSYKAVKTKDIKLYVKWMMYWIVFALFTAAETFTDIFFGFWFPFYYELKVIIVVWLLSPMTRGSSIMYRRVIHPLFMKREQEIDELIARAKDQGYNVILDIGCKGMSLATNAIMSTAVKNVRIPVPSASLGLKASTDVVDSAISYGEVVEDNLVKGKTFDGTEVEMDTRVQSIEVEESDESQIELMYLAEESEEEYRAPKRRTRQSRKREGSTSSTRVTRSRKKVS